MGELKLTGTQAIGVALSIYVKNETMDTCQVLAVSFEDHLLRMGYKIVPVVTENYARGTAYDIEEE